MAGIDTLGSVLNPWKTHAQRCPSRPAAVSWLFAQCVRLAGIRSSGLFERYLNAQTRCEQSQLGCKRCRSTSQTMVTCSFRRCRQPNPIVMEFWTSVCEPSAPTGLAQHQRSSSRSQSSTLVEVAAATRPSMCTMLTTPLFTVRCWQYASPPALFS